MPIEIPLTSRAMSTPARLCDATKTRDGDAERDEHEAPAAVEIGEVAGEQERAEHPDGVGLERSRGLRCERRRRHRAGSAGLGTVASSSFS